VLLAEQANGPIPRRNGSSYVWGAALGQLERMQPVARIINLETAVTRSHDRANRGINYRVSPEECRMSRGCQDQLDAYWPTTMCSIGGRAGLLETLTTHAETQRESDGRRTQRFTKRAHPRC